MERQPGQGTRTPAASSQQAAARRGPGLPLSRRFDGARYPGAATALVTHADDGLESWVEVSSQPSSSSLSSVGDEIVTTGLCVGGPRRRRRRSQPTYRSLLPPQPTTVQAAGMSSQDEYEESESEDDRLLKSSAEVVQPSHKHACDDSDVDADDGDDATALGRASDRQVFRPQPNAFSYPPQSNAPRRSYSTTSTAPPHSYGVVSRPSLSQRSQTARLPRHFVSPANAREDNDAALRASLTTLLSCAAAARGLPKTREEAEARRLASAGVGPSNQPMELRLIPESELMGEVSTTQPDSRTTSGAQEAEEVLPSRATREKPKRAISAGRSPRAMKKKKMAAATVDEDALISPTLLTWVMSAGVVVLVSVVGFGAGYVIGREVGRQEGLSASVSSVNVTTRCGREVISSSGGLRRLRWGAVGKSIAAQT